MTMQSALCRTQSNFGTQNCINKTEWNQKDLIIEGKWYISELAKTESQGINKLDEHLTDLISEASNTWKFFGFSRGTWSIGLRDMLTKSVACFLKRLRNNQESALGVDDIWLVKVYHLMEKSHGC